MAAVGAAVIAGSGPAPAPADGPPGLVPAAQDAVPHGASAPARGVYGGTIAVPSPDDGTLGDGTAAAADGDGAEEGVEEGVEGGVEEGERAGDGTVGLPESGAEEVEGAEGTEGETGVLPEAPDSPEFPEAAPDAEAVPAEPVLPGQEAFPDEPSAPEAWAAPGEADAAAAAKGLEAAVTYALAHVGDPYALGGKGPHRWDCSGLVQEAYRRAGVRLPRIAADQYRATARIPRSALRRGDLVFWSRDGKAAGVHHVAIYLGGSQYLEAARPGTKVRVSTFSRYNPNLFGRVRLPKK
ncbi:C40 family peptidase [Streptomyces sp. I05A-00742]|uniref:C40 family peptidase n=1 Tax=Streptomyces sp. I05A-00742 TaxID=2732853 RepID=UPI001488EDF8|nr:C40 family peptidase [Streptomyces sp. I05A-00742]